MEIKKGASTSAARTNWITLTAACFTLLAGTAQATELVDSVPQKVVSFRDLNLKSTKDVAVLYSRIHSAAIQVCGGVIDASDLARAASVRPCLEKSMVEAVTTVNSPMLTSLYLAKSGRTGLQFPTVALAR